MTPAPVPTITQSVCSPMPALELRGAGLGLVEGGLYLHGAGSERSTCCRDTAVKLVAGVGGAAAAAATGSIEVVVPYSRNQ